MYLIKRRLEREYGMRARVFNYPSVKGTLDENAQALARFVTEQNCARVSIIGHSLGGVLALRAIANHPEFPPGRVVCLGSPLTGSRAGRVLDEFDWAVDIIGKSLPEGVIHQSADDWAADVATEREVAVIAGTVPLGIGRLVAKLDEPNDGTVAVSETRLDGISEHLTMNVSHKGMLASAGVADQAAAFIKRGEFLR